MLRMKIVALFRDKNKMTARKISRRIKESNTVLRTFARKFSNVDFFLKILPLKDDELVMSAM